MALAQPGGQTWLPGPPGTHCLHTYTQTNFKYKGKGNTNILLSPKDALQACKQMQWRRHSALFLEPWSVLFKSSGKLLDSQVLQKVAVETDKEPAKSSDPDKIVQTINNKERVGSGPDSRRSETQVKKPNLSKTALTTCDGIRAWDCTHTEKRRKFQRRSGL